jgi:uncharacterized protein
MPSKEIEKIKWAPNPNRKKRWIIVGAVFTLLLTIGIWHSTTKTTTLHVTNGDTIKNYKLSKAVTPEQQERGLSGTSAMAKTVGLLFIFKDYKEQCFWMKDMKYNLDIIWTDAQKRITRIEKNLSPNTYPSSYCAKGQYVIELNAGEADKSGMQKGQTLSF